MMTDKNLQFHNVWILRASLVIAFVIMLLSWLSHWKIPYIILQTLLSFAVMYLLLATSWYLFKKNSLPGEQEEPAEREIPEEFPASDGRGTLFDAAVGDDLDSERFSDDGQLANDSQFAGYRLDNKYPGSGAESGPAPGPIPAPLSAGQMDRSLFEGLPDAERQAEIVRRMGWEEEDERT